MSRCSHGCLQLLLVHFHFCHLTLFKVIIVLHHLHEGERFLSNLYTLLLFLEFLSLEVRSMRFLILCLMLWEQDLFVFFENVGAFIDRGTISSRVQCCLLMLVFMNYKIATGTEPHVLSSFWAPIFISETLVTYILCTSSNAGTHALSCVWVSC